MSEPEKAEPKPATIGVAEAMRELGVVRNTVFVWARKGLICRVLGSVPARFTAESVARRKAELAIERARKPVDFGVVRDPSPVFKLEPWQSRSR